MNHLQCYQYYILLLYYSKILKVNYLIPLKSKLSNNNSRLSYVNCYCLKIIAKNTQINLNKNNLDFWGIKFLKQVK
jgi:hypothetical protein